MRDRPEWNRDDWMESLDADERLAFVFATSWTDWLESLDDAGREYASWLHDAFVELGFPHPEFGVTSEMATGWPTLASIHFLHPLWRDLVAQKDEETLRNIGGGPLLDAGTDPALLGSFLQQYTSDVLMELFYRIDGEIDQQLWDDRFPGWKLMEVDCTGLIEGNDPDFEGKLTGRQMHLRDHFGPMDNDSGPNG